MDYAIETKNLSKRFGDFQANDAVSIKVPRDAIMGLIGRNGAGKTTFMRLLLGLFEPTDGKITMLGCTGDQIEEARRKTGCMIETPAFYTKLSANENLMIRAKLIGLEHPKEAIRDVLKKVGLYEKRNNKVKSLSLGMRQSLGIAYAILGDPELLILDEPVNGLDPIAIANIRKILQEMNQKGTTILISSHILGEMEKLATCYAFIVNGKLVKEISEEELKNEHMDLEEMFIKISGGEINE